MLRGKKLINPKKARDNRGFSVIEALVVISILSVTIFFIVSIFPSGLANSQFAVSETTAVNLAQSKIEEIVGTSYGDLQVGTTTEATLANLDPDFFGFKRITVIKYVDENLNDSLVNNGLKKARVLIYWFDPKKATSSVTLSTIIVKH